MTQLSKLLQSRDEWKDKAIQRGYENRASRKTHKRLTEKIAALKLQRHDSEMEQLIAGKKNASDSA